MVERASCAQSRDRDTKSLQASHCSSVMRCIFCARAAGAIRVMGHSARRFSRRPWWSAELPHHPSCRCPARACHRRVRLSAAQLACGAFQLPTLVAGRGIADSDARRGGSYWRGSRQAKRGASASRLRKSGPLRRRGLLCLFDLHRGLSQDVPMTTVTNHPAAGKAARIPRFTIGRRRRGLPESGRSATMRMP